LCDGQQNDLHHIDWKDTRVILPGHAPNTFQHLFSAAEGYIAEGIAVKEIFKNLPLAVLKLK